MSSAQATTPALPAKDPNVPPEKKADDGRESPWWKVAAAVVGAATKALFDHLFD